MSKDVNKPRKPKMVFQMMKPGQSQEDFMQEMREKHGDVQMMDGSDMNPKELKEMLAKMGIDADDLEGMMENGEKKKKPGIFEKMKDAFMG